MSFLLTLVSWHQIQLTFSPNQARCLKLIIKYGRNEDLSDLREKEKEKETFRYVKHDICMYFFFDNEVKIILNLINFLLLKNKSLKIVACVIFYLHFIYFFVFFFLFLSLFSSRFLKKRFFSSNFQKNARFPLIFLQTFFFLLISFSFFAIEF